MNSAYTYQNANFYQSACWSYSGGDTVLPFAESTVNGNASLQARSLADGISFSAAAGATPAYTITGNAYSQIPNDPNGSIAFPTSIGWNALANGPSPALGTPGGSVNLNVTVDNGIDLTIDVMGGVQCNNLTITAGNFLGCDGMGREVSVSGNITVGATSVFNGGQGTLKMSGTTTQTIFANNSDNPSSTKVQLKNLQVLKNKTTQISGHVRMKPGGALTFDEMAVNDALALDSVNASSITFESGASGTAAIGPCEASNFEQGTPEKFTFQRYIPADPDGSSWVNIGAYVTGTTVADWTAANPSMFIFEYKETNFGSIGSGWNFLWDGTTVLTPGSGYMAMLPQGQDALISVTGGFQIGDVDIDLTFTDDPNQSNTQVDGWNLVSNPYPAPVNMLQVLDGTGISTWYIFDNVTADAYVASGSDMPTNVLDIGQSAWVKVNAATTITFSEEDKVTSTSGTFIREINEEYEGTLGMEISNASDNLGRTFVKFQANTSTGYEVEHDALMYNSTGTADLGVWMVAETGEKLSRQAAGLQNEVTSLPLKVNSGAGGATSFYAYDHPETPELTCGVIEDTETGERAQLGRDTLVVDLAPNTHYADRFVLHFTPTPSMTWESTACDGLAIDVAGEAWESWDAAWTADDGSAAGTGLPYELADGDYTFEFTLPGSVCVQAVDVTVETACLGDFNQNGERDVVDLLVLLADLPGGALENAFALQADCDCDGAVTVSDMLAFLTVFGTACD
jgi:hypothetical protein